ncbi:uncharacterized protein LOC124355986 [Homalodisca vitripennis]|uniref:uncharacterized protein LOC124355986 n=1 Tax=Homalodisca vitripennis TaxID=197043 RepID=UPI001EE9E599|nr:uncharacterized protein LOC124355986 [Homalodisca vitripennis]
MALLYRFVKIPDRADTHVFTFIVTKSVTRDLERDITSKEFTCGHQRWAITFSRTDKVLGVYLVWRSTSEAMRVYVDFTFTLLNRDHFSHNEAFSGKQVKFTTECPAQGNRNYIAVSELYVRNFADNNGEFQLELSMGHVRTMFDTDFRVPSSIFGHQMPRQHHQSAAKNPPQATKLETTYFTYGGFDWNLALYPNGIKDIHDADENGVKLRPILENSNEDGRVSVYLNRCTGFDHQCRVRYSLVLGDGPRRVDSGPVDDVSDSDGKSYGWHTTARFQDLVYKGSVRVHLEMLMANTLSEVVSTIVVQHASAAGSSGSSSGGTHGVVVAAPAVTQCYDRDKQAWCIKSDCHSDTVRLHMVYKDIHNVPRNHLRYVCWMAYLLRYDEETREMVPKPLPGAPFSHYYAQENSDEGIIMETDVGVKEVCRSLVKSVFYDQIT